MYEYSKEDLLKAIQSVDTSSTCEPMFLYGLRKDLDMVRKDLPNYIYPVVIPDSFNFDKKFDGKLYLIPQYRTTRTYEFII